MRTSQSIRFLAAGGSGVGKALQLEVKTARPTTTGHSIDIWLDQLARYTSPSWRIPVYYVLVLPEWTGQVPDGRATITWPSGQSHVSATASEMGFSRSDPAWFARWARVIPAARLRSLLDPKLALTGTVQLLNWTSPTKSQTTASQPPQYVPGQLTPSVNFPKLQLDDLMPWRDFWDLMDTCGNSNFPAVFVLDSPIGNNPSREDLAAALRPKAESAGDRDPEPGLKPARDAVEVERPANPAAKQAAVYVPELPNTGQEGEYEKLPDKGTLGPGGPMVDEAGTGPILTVIGSGGLALQARD